MKLSDEQLAEIHEDYNRLGPGQCNRTGSLLDEAMEKLEKP